MIGRTSSQFTVAAIVASVTSASHCLIGWPVVVGPSTKDGSSEVTAWSATPFSDTYLIGGTSNSADFTEDSDCAENTHGCAYLTNWNKVSQEFEQKWIFTAVYSVSDIVFDPTELYFTVVFKQYNEDEEKYKHVLTFNDWPAYEKSATMSSKAYILNEAFDEEIYNDPFGQLHLYQEDRFHFISNNPNELQSTDYFFIMNDG